MKKFRYRYENILKLKEKEEDRVKNEMAKLNSSLSIAKDKLKMAYVEEEEYLKSVEQLMTNGCTAMELRSTINNKAYLRGQIETCGNEVKHLEHQLGEKKAELVEAMKERKIYEKLKEREFESFKEDLKAAEEKVVDQIVSYNSRK